MMWVILIRLQVMILVLGLGHVGLVMGMALWGIVYCIIFLKRVPGLGNNVSLNLVRWQQSLLNWKKRKSGLLFGVVLLKC